MRRKSFFLIFIFLLVGCGNKIEEMNINNTEIVIEKEPENKNVIDIDNVDIKESQTDNIVNLVDEVVIEKKTVDECQIGEIIDKVQICTTDEWFIVYQLNKRNDICNIILDKSYKENENISLEDLSYIKLVHYNYNHEIQVGELIVNNCIAEDIKEIFIELYDKEYEIQSMYLIDNFWQGNADDTDTQSIEKNNTSAFCYREITNGGKLSNHAYGTAIDINPEQNPYVSYKTGKAVWYHKNADQYIDRSINQPHMINKEDECYKAFISHGFSWGGDWNTIKDYQHFELKR